MLLKNKNFICMDSFKDLYENIEVALPSTLLISENILLNNTQQVSNALEGINIRWIIIIGKNPLFLEEYLDDIIETNIQDYILDVITTSFQYDEVEDITFEFLVTSRLGLEEYQFISILDFNNSQELKIIELINKKIDKQQA